MSASTTWYTLKVVHGDGSTSSDEYSKESSTSLDEIVEIASSDKYEYNSGWNKYVWVEDDTGKTVWER